MVTITLTKEQAKKLSEVLWETQDEGPYGEGWASDELCALRSLVDEAIEAANVELRGRTPQADGPA